ncbi:MAG: hypothetical protein ABIS86_05940, partial [Streptosporangiaceae bacterium]
TISNELTRTVTVMVRIFSNASNLVVGGKKAYFQVEKTIEAGSNDALLVPMSFNGPPRAGNKNSPVTVVISSKAGRKLHQTDIGMNMTGADAAGVSITIGALAVVVVGVGFRGMRARRRRTEAEDAQHGGATDVL